MIRTVWIAAFCLAGIGGLFASRVAASMAPTEETVLDPPTVRAGIAQDTLTKADRLDLTYLNPLVETAPVPPSKPFEILQTKPSAKSTSSRRLSNRNANRIAVMLPKPRPKPRLSKETSTA